MSVFAAISEEKIDMTVFIREKNSDGTPYLFTIDGKDYESQSGWKPIDHTVQDEQPCWWTHRAFCTDDEQEYDIAIDSDSWKILVNPRKPDIVSFVL